MLGQAVPETLSQCVRELVASVPWGHHVELMKKLKDPAARLYYLRATAQFGWSRSVLLNQIKGQAYERAVKDDVEVEFALKTKANPIGVAEYQLQETLPAEFKGKLPTARQLADVAREFLPIKPQRTQGTQRKKMK
ncbi:MAG: DUF1016 family protein [Verrucomicrobia bacterium]|nr:MAG: DUF1016 family protein [Verrucomicrobiota bacterium]